MEGVLFESWQGLLGHLVGKSARSNMSDEETEIEVKKTEAERAKIEGNKAFRANDYKKALELYNTAIELDPGKVKYFSMQVLFY